MKRSWNKIRVMVANNQTHRKGFRLGELATGDILSHALDEMNELDLAPDDPTEMADVFGCLIHYCIKQGWTAELIEELLLDKLRQRFPGVDA